MADDRFASVADALLRIQSARSLEEAVRIAREAGQRGTQPADGFDRDAPFRYLFDQNPTPMWVYELGSLAFLEVNQAAIQLYGYTRDEFLGMRITDIRPSEDVPKLLELTTNRPPGLRHVGKWRHRLKSGTVIDVDVSSSTIEFGGRPAVLVVARDITQQVQIEARLRDVEGRFLALIQNAPFVTYVKDTEGHYVFYNRESERVFGIGSDQHIGKTIHDVTDRTFAAIVDEMDRNVVAAGEPIVMELRFPPGVAYEWAMVIKFPIRDETGKVIAIGGFDIDTTKQKRAELALATSEAQRQATEQRFRRVFDLVQEGIWIHVDGKVQFANPAAARLFGAKSPEDLIGMPVFNIIHPDDRERAIERTRNLKEKLQPLPLTEMRILGLDGKTRIGELQAAPFIQNGILHVISSGRDVTAQRDAESRLHQAQKMDAVGQLTGGVAHDFNNLLTVIIGALDLDPQRIPAEMRPAIEQAMRAAERGAALTHRLLAFSRQQMLVTRSVDFNRLIGGDMDELLRRTLGEHVEIELKLAGDLWPALADSGQVENSLLNLAINARDAMPEGGKLTIETANVHLDDDYASSNAEVMPGDYVMMAVTDTGTGMPPDVLAHVFEPFFTTKEVGKGTGLGLSMIYGFAKQSGGHVKIYSEVGHGTTVRLYLPRLTSESLRSDSAAAAPPHQGGGETILVVEDNPDVRRLVLRQLRDLGYEVIEAAHGPQALTILDEGAAIDLLFTDVVMPGGMTGRQLAEAAKVRRPNLKTLFTSGYTEDSILRLGKLDPGVRLLSKPYRKHELATRIREALDG